MPIYEHIQDLKRDEQLQQAEKINTCLTCRFWEVEQRRTESLVKNVACCLQPELKKAQLIVSGGSGCRNWAPAQNISEDAEAYAHRGEAFAR